MTGENQVYRELLEEFPEAPPEAIEAALQFMRVAAQIHVRREALLNQHGLTSGRFSLLMLLRHEPTRSLSHSDLAKRAKVTRATMTQFIDALENDEFVRRITDVEDRRSVLVKLTVRGDNLLKRILPEYLKRLGHFTTALSRTERKQLLSLMEKLTQDLAVAEEE